MKTPYDIYDAYKSEMLTVGSGHKIYVEQAGNPNGQPVVFFHGGPGGLCKPKNRRFFNPEKYRVILFDQRGCGKSEYTDLLKDNTTQDLINDAEQIRKHLGIETWHVFGGSWGSTLALAYSEQYPQRVKSLIVRGIYFGSKAENDWLFGGGAEKFFPEKFQELDEFMKLQGLVVNTENIAKLVFADDKDIAYKAAKLSDDWEGAVYLFEPESEEVESIEIDKDELLNSKKVMFHYFQNNCFLKNNQLLANAQKLKGIPTAIVQGRYDLVCPFETAWKLSQTLPNAEFKIISAGGHSSNDAATSSALVDFTERFANL